MIKSKRTLGALLAGLVAALAAIVTFPLHAEADQRPLRHREAATAWQKQGINYTSSGNCAIRSNPTCTSMSGMRKSTAAGVIELKRNSGAKVTVTGGTEVGHAKGTYSHGNGYKVDIRKNSRINSYIKSNGKAIGGSKYRIGNDVYYDEGDHWDITFK